MYAEFKFIFDPGLEQQISKNVRTDNSGDIYGRLPEKYKIFYKTKPPGTVRNTIKDIYTRMENGDPYIKLVEYFNENTHKSMTLKYADFAYLKDLGVFPINRLIIMRRYAEGVVVPGNLLEWGNKGPKPIATVIGWVKEGSDSFFTFNFGEVWKDQHNTIDKVFGEIFKKEFGISIGKTVPIPGWSQGFLWGFLNNTGLGSGTYDWKKTPVGDPNVLRTAVMRTVDGQGLTSDFTIAFETEYEQKFISGADPSQAMLDIISNLTTFGTSNMNFYLRQNSDSMKRLITALNATSTDRGANYQDWVDLISSLATSFFTGIEKTIKDIKKDSLPTTSKKTNGNNDEFKSALKDGLELQDGLGSGTLFKSLKGLGENFLDILIAGTIIKWRWPLKGSIGLMTGLPTTPWHITIGNPYSPVLSLNNIVVKKVNLDVGTEMGMGDMPNNLKVGITLELGRPLGKQEIDTAFNNSYRRVYATSTTSTTSTVPTQSDNSNSGYKRGDSTMDGNVAITYENIGSLETSQPIPTEADNTLVNPVFIPELNIRKK